MRKATSRPRLECLEDRNLLSVVLFNLDQASSQLDLSGSGGGQPIQEQQTGSLSTTYQGAVAAEVDLDKLTITFLGTDFGSTAAADNFQRPLQPAENGEEGSAPANYGGRFNFFGPVDAAIRGLRVNATSNVLPLQPSDVMGVYGFPSTQSVNILAGVIDYRHSSAGSGRQPLGSSSRNSATDGTLMVNDDGTFSLTLLIGVRFNYEIKIGIATVPVTLNLNGMLSGASDSASRPVSGQGSRVAFAQPLGMNLDTQAFHSFFIPATNPDNARFDPANRIADEFSSVVAVLHSGTLNTPVRPYGAAADNQLLAIDAVAVEMLK